MDVFGGPAGSILGSLFVVAIGVVIGAFLRSKPAKTVFVWIVLAATGMALISVMAG